MSRLLIAILVFGASMAATAQPEQFGECIKSLQVNARQQQLPDWLVDEVLGGLVYQQRVIELDRAQPGATNSTAIPAFAPYKAQHVDTARIARGRQTYLAQRSRLQRRPGRHLRGIEELTWSSSYAKTVGAKTVRSNTEPPDAAATTV